jgi:multidrug transporter EmrE-like cation transporter
MIWALTTLILNTAAQVILKYSTKVSTSLIPGLNFLTWPFVVAMGLYVLSVLTWVQALKEMTLSHAYPIMAATLITVPVFAMIIFKDNITALQWVFLGLALSGLVGFALVAK